MELRNERLLVSLAEGSRNLRFDNTAIVTQVVLDGEYAFCTREQVLPGRRSTNGIGLCGEFVLDGAAEQAKADEWFLKPGVGLLRQTQDFQPYDLWQRYEVRPFPVTSEETDGGAIFRQAGDIPIEKRFSLEDDRLSLTITAANLTDAAIMLREYQHNFLTLGAPVAEGWVLELDCDRELGRIESETLRQGDEIRLPSAVRVEESRVMWVGGMEEKIVYHRSHSTAGEIPARWRLVHQKTGLSVSETTDFLPDRVDIWAVEHCVCPEFYHSVRLAPGETAQWQRTWRFGAPR